MLKLITGREHMHEFITVFILIHTRLLMHMYGQSDGKQYCIN